MSKPAVALVAICSAALGLSPLADAQPRTHIHDPLRGVTFHSVEVSNVPVNTLDVVEGSFAASDALAVGLSALVFDGASGVEEYVLWIRHEGRRWLELDLEQPVTVEVDGDPLRLARLRAPEPFVGASSRLFEKIEYGLAPADLKRLAGAADVRIRLASSSGVVEKRLREQELGIVRAFRDWLAASVRRPA